MIEHKESQSIIILSTIILLLMVFSLITLYIIFIRKKTELLITQRNKEIGFEKELSESLVEMKEQTLKHIGQELHDNIGQKLSVVRLRSNQLTTKLNEKEKDELNDVSLLLGECIQDIRNLSKTLIINDLDNFDLYEFLLLEFEKLKKIKIIHFHQINNLKNNSYAIHPKHSLIIFRMIQESVNNIYKHSKAKNITIQLDESSKYYIFIIQDDGIGFNPSEKFEGRGVSNIKERAKLIHAKYKLYSELGKGTQTIIKYPIT